MTAITDAEPGDAVSRLAESVDALRSSLNISYRALAERIGIDHVRLYRMLARRQGVSVYVLGQAMIALGHTMEGR